MLSVILAPICWLLISLSLFQSVSDCYTHASASNCGSLRPTVEIGQSTTATNVFVVPPFGGVYTTPNWQDMILLGYDAEVYEPTEFELKTLDGSVWIIDENKGLVRVTEPNGNTVSFGPNGITSSAGASVVFQRDGAGRINKVTDPLGNALNYTYDGNGNLTAVTDREGKVTQFTYNGLGLMISMRDARGVNVLGNEFSDTGRLTQSRDALGNASNFTHGIDDPALADNIEVVRDRLNNRTVQAFNARGNITTTTKYLKLTGGGERGITTSTAYGDSTWPDKPTSVTDALGRTTTMTYDSNGYMTSVTNPLGFTKTSTFNSRGGPLVVTDANGNQTVKTYDAIGRLLTTTDALGHTTTNTYDALGQLSAVTDVQGNTRTFVHDAFGRLIRDTDPRGHIVEYAYDGLGRRVSESKVRTRSDGSVEVVSFSLEYDKEGRPVKNIAPDGSFTRVVYDNNGQPIENYDALNRLTRNDYDQRGLLTSTQYPDGTISQMIYDSEERVFRTTSPRGLITETNYDSLGRMVLIVHRSPNLIAIDSTSTTYNDAGEVVATTDARGNTSTFTYDLAGQRLTSTDALENITTNTYDPNGWLLSTKDASNQTTTFTYDVLGRVTQTTTLTGISSTVYDLLGRAISKTDQAGRKTSMVYDIMNRLMSVTDAGGFTTSYTYDELGQKITQTDANGHVTRFSYDNMGRLIGRMLPMGQVASSGYRADGSMATHTDFNGHTTTYNYAPSGRLLSKVGWNGEAIAYTYTADGLVASKTRNGTITTSYTYDLFGRMTSVTSPAGTIGYSYDVAGNRTSMVLPSGTVGYEYDALNRVSAVIHPGGARTTYTYNAVGNRLSKVLPNGVTTTYGYDASNRLTSVANSVGSSFTYVLDASGKRLSVTDSVRGTTIYGYDLLGRLVSETSPTSSITFTYDVVGNRLSKTVNGASVSYTYNANDQMLNEGTKTFAYDANGNTITANGQTLTYDFEDHLISTSGGGSGSTSYIYDADGMRLERIVNVQVSSYLYDPLGGYGNVVEERAGLTGTLIARYDSGLDLIRMDRGGFASYYVQDGLGSVVALTNSAGLVTDSYGYDAFGNSERLSGTTANPFLFNGQQYDETEELYYLRARYYAPGQGRFITHDPLMGKSGDPQSLHRYLYANADPVNSIDPTGMMTTKEEGAAVLDIGTRMFNARMALLRNAYYAAKNLEGISKTTRILTIAVRSGNVIKTSQISAVLGLSVLGAVGLSARSVNKYLELAQHGEEVGCFTEDTEIEYYEKGNVYGKYINIKEFVNLWNSGAELFVYARDQKTKKNEICKVSKAWSRVVTSVVTVELASADTGKIVEVVTGTVEHPFMTPLGWIKMGKLGIGTKIQTRAGPNFIVKSVRHARYPNGIKVYNFTVDNKHTYFAGKVWGGSWVHNVEGCPLTEEEIEGLRIAERNIGENYFDRFGNYKTIGANSTGSFKTLSGWGNVEGFTQDTQKVLNESRMYNIELPVHKYDQGVDGRFHASHAELQQAVQGAGIIAVNTRMCSTCKRWLAEYSKHTGRRIVVSDGYEAHIFDRGDYISYDGDR
jgi:RHS repeat-associated protein